MTPDDELRELYALAPAEFTAARNERAKATGDRARAAELRALKKPSTAAWAVNLLAGREPDRLASLLAVGDLLRDATGEADAVAVKKLSGDRRRGIADVTKRATSLAASLGQPLSAAAITQVEETLQAAVSDPDAASAVSSGVLTRTLRSEGFGAVDLSDAVAAETTNRRPTKPDASRRADQLARRDARERLRSAERELEDAESAAAGAHERSERAEADLRSARERVERLEAGAASASRDERRLRRDLDSATRGVKRARAALDRLEGEN